MFQLANGIDGHMREVLVSTCKVELIQASRCIKTGQEIFTLICEYPRAIHAQLLTHRVFSKNSSSTRAVPIKKAVEQLRANPAKYIWTENQSGMQGSVIKQESKLEYTEYLYNHYMESAIRATEELSDPAGLNIHKQNAGRLLEPFQNIKIVLTSTEWDNWDWLRIDGAAQGEIRELALAIYEARKSVEPMEIGDGEWHVPFVDRSRGAETGDIYYGDGLTRLTPEEAVAVSTSVCAQTSYRNADYSLKKAEELIPKLFDGAKVHASPSEHQATPVPEMQSNTSTVSHFLARMPKGVTHMDRFSTPWSGNFRNFIQNRQLLPNHDKALEN